MKYLDHPFDVATGAGRRPTPTKYVHLRKWAAKDEKFLVIHNQNELVNVNQQLDQTSNFQVSNIISRVIAQLIAPTDLGMRTIEATEAGALKVAIDGLLSDTKNLEHAKIDIATIAPHEIIAATAGQKIHVVDIVFTVGGPVGITLMSGATDISGPMDFGDTGEPRGIVIPLGLGPLVCGTAEAFVIDLDAAVQVSGFCTYYKQLA